MTCRPFVDVATPPGGWGLPWPNVAEIAAALPHENWTLVGGLMTQLHAFHAGIDVIRPTNDVDIVLHLETTRGVAAAAATALEGLGYVLATSIDRRRAGSGPRGTQRRRETARARHGLHRRWHQALRRTVNARLTIAHDRVTTVSVPDVLGAVVLKAAAYRTDSHDPDRHLRDAASLLYCLADPFVEHRRNGQAALRILTA